jgi:hypothetical protein
LKPECVVGEPSASRRWLIVGDSHAQALSGAFDLWLRQRGESGLMLYEPGCLPLPQPRTESRGTRCTEYGDQLRSLWRQGGFENVFLVSSWRQLIEVEQQSRGKRAAKSDFQVGFSQLAAEAVADQRKLFVWLPLPPAKKNVPTALARAALFGLGWNISTSLQEHRREYRFIAEGLAEESTRVQGVVDASAVLCGSAECATVINGRPVYYDSTHPAASQADYFARILDAQLPRDEKKSRTKRILSAWLGSELSE